MKGSEKQIAWAADIQKKAIAGVESIRSRLDAQKAGSADMIVNYISNAQYASDIIEVFGKFHDLDGMKVLGCIRTASTIVVTDKKSLEEVKQLFKR